MKEEHEAQFKYEWKCRRETGGYNVGVKSIKIANPIARWSNAANVPCEVF